MNAAKIVNSSIIGADFKTIVINNKSYVISPPTIHKIAGAGCYLALSFISAENFYKLSVLAKNVRNLTAKQK